MQLQGRDLTHNDQGADVRLLQFELQVLDLQLYDDEFERNFFGDSTLEAVMQIQDEYGINRTGVVNHTTANQINFALLERVGPQAALNSLAELINVKVDEIFNLDPAQPNLKDELQRLATSLRGFALALEELREHNVDGDHVANLQEMIDQGETRLRELGYKPQEDDRARETSGFFVVSGTVRREDGRLLPNISVQAFHEAEQGDIELGETVTGAGGRYTIRYMGLSGVEAINLSVSATAVDGSWQHASEILYGAKPVESIDLTVPVARQRADRYRIEGRIIYDHGLPAENLRLRLYRRNFGGGTTRLAETRTLAGGRYAFSYLPGDKAVSLEVRAASAQNEERLLSKPLNHISREPIATLNLIAPGDLQPLAPEYGRLAADLRPYAGQMSRLAGALENGERQDLTVLNRMTGWDARLIGLAALAERLRADPDVNLPGEALYGLLRAGLPSDKNLLAQVEPDVAERALKKVSDAGIVSFNEQQIAAFREAFNQFSTNVRLNISAPGSNSTYNAFLQAAPGLSDDARRNFGPIYLNHRGSAGELWERGREAGLAEEEISTLQLQGKFAFLAGNSEEMTSRLMAKELNSPAQLVDQDLHSADAWKTELFELADIPEDRRDNLSDADKEKLGALIPTAYAAEEVEGRLNAYAQDMARKVRLSYPTQVVGKLLETEAAFALPEAHEATVSLLKKAAGQGFRLGETPAAKFLQTHAGVTADIADEEIEAAGRQLQTLQRVYQITPSNEAMPVLLSLGMTSAYDVTAYSEEEFVELYVAKYQEMYGDD